MTDETLDKAKGRVKEAAGAVSGDSSLKNEGRVEQAKGSMKKAAEKVEEAVTGRKRDRDY